MSARPFDELPDHSRLWIFAATQPLAPPQQERIRAEAERFVEGWLAHGAPVVGAYDLRHGRFLLVAADEEATGVSGCSIDALFRTLKALEAELQVTLLDSAPVWYRRRDGGIEAVPRAEFRARAAAGEVDGDTVVFDNTVRNVGQLSRGEWERPARDSWHARLLGS